MFEFVYIYEIKPGHPDSCIRAFTGFQYLPKITKRRWKVTYEYCYTKLGRDIRDSR